VQFDATATDPGHREASTRLRVARSILENGPSTAADLGRRLGLTPAAVRRHLDHLAGSGDVVSEEAPVRGSRGRGRPARVFRLTDAGRDRFDQQYDDLAAQALRFLRDTQGEDAVAEFARRRVAFIERDYDRIVRDDPALSPSEALAAVLSREGYAASVRDLPDTAHAEQLCQQHCPVAHVAHEFPQLCEAETEAIGRVLGTHVQRLATIAHGDGVCTTCIPQVQQDQLRSTTTHETGAAGRPGRTEQDTTPTGKDGAS
jgi:predicted ArsR family transcriptional regulator